jgi:hypothetical protein
MFVLCKHRVGEDQYEISRCPRCYGKGHYFDIHFDQDGQVVLATGALKLQQELLKISLEDKGGNIFHPDWGNEVRKTFSGSKNTSSVRQKVELSLIKTIDYLRNIQEGNQLRYKNMANDEIIAAIDKVDVFVVGQAGCQVHMQIRNKLNEAVSFSYSVKQ